MKQSLSNISNNQVTSVRVRKFTVLIYLPGQLPPTLNLIQTWIVMDSSSLANLLPLRRQPAFGRFPAVSAAQLPGVSASSAQLSPSPTASACHTLSESAGEPPQHQQASELSACHRTLKQIYLKSASLASVLPSRSLQSLDQSVSETAS